LCGSHGVEGHEMSRAQNVRNVCRLVMFRRPPRRAGRYVVAVSRSGGARVVRLYVGRHLRLDGTLCNGHVENRPIYNIARSTSVAGRFRKRNASGYFPR